MSGKRRTPNGFTLVELLVVIGIIAVLISILLPSLSRARQAANTVKCASNIRQIMMGFQLYASENKDLLPAQRVPGKFEWSRTIVATMVGEDAFLNSGAPGTTAGYFRCPNDDLPRSQAANYVKQIPRSYAATGGKYYCKTNTAYKYPWPWDASGVSSGTPGTGNPAYPPAKLSSVPNRIFLIGEEFDVLQKNASMASQMLVGQSSYYTLEGHFALVHPGNGKLGGNYGFSDGHVEFHVPDDYIITPGQTADYDPSGDYGGDPRDPWKWYPGRN